MRAGILALERREREVSYRWEELRLSACILQTSQHQWRDYLILKNEAILFLPGVCHHGIDVEVFNKDTPVSPDYKRQCDGTWFSCGAKIKAHWSGCCRSHVSTAEATFIKFDMPVCSETNLCDALKLHQQRTIASIADRIKAETTETFHRSGRESWHLSLIAVTTRFLILRGKDKTALMIQNKDNNIYDSLQMQSREDFSSQEGKRSLPSWLEGRKRSEVRPLQCAMCSHSEFSDRVDICTCSIYVQTCDAIMFSRTNKLYWSTMRAFWSDEWFLVDRSEVLAFESDGWPVCIKLQYLHLNKTNGRI